MKTAFLGLRPRLLVVYLSLLNLLPLRALGQDGHLDKTGWQLDPRLSEDFNEGTTLSSLAARWRFDPGPGPIADKASTSPFELYVTPDNIVLADGYAYLNTCKYSQPIHHANNRDYHYSASGLWSRADDFPTISPAGDTVRGGVLYGMFEVRCKLPGGSGQYPSFWLCGDNAWPPELDAFEFNGSHPGYFFSTVHWINSAFREGSGLARDSAAGQTFYYPPPYLTSDFHTWTVVWTPTQITWFFDGQALRTDAVRRHIPAADMPDQNPYEVCKYRKMNVIIAPTLNYPDAAAFAFEPFVIDYVHVYRPAGLLPYQPAQSLGKYFKYLQTIYQRTRYLTPN